MGRFGTLTTELGLQAEKEDSKVKRERERERMFEIAGRFGTLEKGHAGKYQGIVGVVTTYGVIVYPRRGNGWVWLCWWGRIS